jgi:DNA-binding MarR family transcriptional regulator
MLIQKLQKYIEAVLGLKINLHPVDDGDGLRNLPLYLRSAYSFYTMELLAEKIICMIVEGREYTPLEIQKHRSAAVAALKAPIVFVCDTMIAVNRQRFIERKIPFIVPGKQMYLPMLMVDLREHFDAEKLAIGELSGPAQLLILAYLQDESFNVQTSGSLAARLGYSAMSLSRAVEELIRFELCTYKRNGREKIVEFAENRLELWQKSQRYLNPVKEDMQVQLRIEPVEQYRLAGLNALEKISMINADVIPTYATHWSKYNLIKRKKIEHPDGILMNLQSWRYNPAILSRSECVDPLSLYLSLKNSTDERVQIALEEIIRGMQW